MKKYLVVSFPKENTTEIIPSTWLINEDTCFWPRGNEAANLKNMIMKCVEPRHTWSQVSLKIHGGSNSFSKASEKAEEARYSSNIGSDSSEDASEIKKRQKKLPRRYQNDAGDDESQSLLGNEMKINLVKKKKESSQKTYTLPKPPSGNVIAVRNGNNTEENLSNVTSRVVHEEVQTANEMHTSNPETSAYSQADSFSQFLSSSIATTEQPILQKILKYLVEIKNENKLMRSEIKKLREKVDIKLQVDENPKVAAAISAIVTEDFPNLPLKNLNELQTLESEVTRDASIATSLARFLCRGGGYNNANSLTLLVVKRLLCRDVALKYSLEGRQDKLKFGELNLFCVVIASVKIKFPEAESTGISSRISRVLAGAIDWDGHRIRGKRKIEEVAVQDEDDL